ncbi:hypothetical protein [Nonomuraea dietziae]|uniref:Uncharacterized protein n=1 Tax=Nonomuraea dietziae TaxID=65515 RepID=A0A7W5Y6G8_9ACTN|nr:hypothetical protein [Nonomuraea dietziae]MBB3726153.1 hypothetical protein [Nonomuraea dietziae]
MYVRIALVQAFLAATIGIIPAPGPGAAAERPGAGGTDGVTLLTGDKVVVTGKMSRVRPGPGRQVGFTKQVVDGHLYLARQPRPRPSWAGPARAGEPCAGRRGGPPASAEWANPTDGAGGAGS